MIADSGYSYFIDLTTAFVDQKIKIYLEWFVDIHGIALN